jgi:superfamily I DNA/RNA helicase
MDWFKPYEQLDPEQRDFVDNKLNDNKNFWIQGHAGSGKSILLVHALIKAYNKNPNLKVCFVLYTYALIDMIKTGIPKELKKKLEQDDKLEVMTYFQFQKSSKSYDLILVDEVQDLPTNVVRELKRRSNRVISAGDMNQSIYEGTVSPSEIENLLNAQIFVLKIIHRLTKTLKKIASYFIRGVLGAKEDWNKKDVQVIVGKAKPFSKEEFEFVWRKAKLQASNSNSPTVVLLPFHSSIVKFMNFVLNYENKPTLDENMDDNDARNRYLDKHNIKLEYIGNGFGSLENATSKNKVMIMTYHSSKGLDFKNVFIPNLYGGMTIWRDSEEMSKTLFFVAVTRSRENLYLTYAANSPHKYVALVRDECRVKDISELLDEVKKEENLLSGFSSIDDDDIAY